MKLSISKKYFLIGYFCISIFTLVTGCKKDQLTVKEEKVYAEAGHISDNAYDGGWRLTLKPDGVAEVLPGGDVYYRGTYKINGSKIKVKTEQNSGSYTFNIISETEIKEKEYGTSLILRD
jgi:hypothetical protein